MKPTIPAVLYMSLRTRQLVERPDHTGWTPGDVRQWEDQHETFAGRAEVNRQMQEVRTAQRFIRQMELNAIEDRHVASIRSLQARAEQDRLRASEREAHEGVTRSKPRNPFDLPLHSPEFAARFGGY